MASLYTDTRSLLQILASSVVNIGESPGHVAIIMDGNRRFASHQGLETKFGHRAGRFKGKEVTRWMYEMKVKEITVYTFSIENFKRSRQQIAELMALMHRDFVELVNQTESFIEDDVCIQFVGCWNLVPAKLKPSMARIMVETRHCKSFKINVAVAYTGRNGIVESLKNIEQGIQSGQLLPQDVTEYLIAEAHNVMPMAPVDMMLRSGGDSRISDFMIWEASHAYVHFLDTPWPDVTFWEVWDALVKYQMFRRSEPKLPPSRDALSYEERKRVDKFLDGIRAKKWEDLEYFAKKSNPPGSFMYEETEFREWAKKLLEIA